MHKIMRRLKVFLKNYAGQIGYYACVALVLTAVAVAAERWRGDRQVGETLILPAVELSTPAPREPEPVFVLPEGATVLREYDDRPEWNEELLLWETHMATDYACEDGVVRSVSEGVVKTIGKSGVYGGFVEVEAGEYLLRYASIVPSERLEVGEKVKKEEELGRMDDSMAGEAYMPVHLHLELLQEGKCLDFAKECAKKVVRVD